MTQQLLPHTLEGEVLLKSAAVSVVGFLHFIKRDRIDALVPAGGTINDLLEEAIKDRPRTGLDFDLSVCVNGRPVPKEWWSRVRPREGTTLTFTPRLRGDSIGSLFMIAAAIAAMVVAPWLVGPSMLGLTGFMATAAQGLIGGAILFGGMMLSNALFPVRPPQLENKKEEDRKSLSSLSSGSNRFAPYEPLPGPLGEHRYFPPWGATPYTETQGDRQYLRVLVIWGIGRHEVTDLKIGETPLTEFNDYEMEHRDGSVGDAPITLITKDIHEEAVNLELISDTSAEDDPVRYTQIETDAVSIDVVAPNGIFRLDKKDGDKKPHDVDVEFYYRAAYSPSAWILFTTISFRRETDAARRGQYFKFPANGQYEIRASKRTGAEGDHIMHQVIWSVLRSITKKNPLNFPKPLCMTALRIRASEQLSGTLQTINGIVKPYMTAYDGTTWATNQLSSNPADNFRHVLQGAAQGRPKLNSEIDLITLAEWWDFCKRHKYKFKQVRDSPKGTWDVLADIAAAGCAVPIHKDGKWSVAWDRDDALVKQHFTPKNAWGLTFNKQFFEEAHAFRIPFINELRNWAQDERTVYDDGYNSGNATKFDQIELPGVTHPDHVWKLGRRHIAQLRLRPDTISFTTDWEILVCTRGDRIHLAYDTLRIGQASGYVKESGTTAGDQWIKVDETLFLEGAKDYAIRWRRASDGQSFLRSVKSSVAGEKTQISVVGTDTLPDAGDLFSFGEVGLVTGLFRVKEIENQENLFARITVVDDAPGIDDAEKGEIPPYVTNISDPVNYYAVFPTNLVVIGEGIERQGAGFRAVAKVSWQITRMATVERFQVQVRDVDANGEWVNAGSTFPPKTSFNVPIEAAGDWAFRVRALFKDEKPSRWTESKTVSLLGLSTPPENIKNLRRTWVTETSVLDWDDAIDIRPVKYEVRRGADFDASMTVAEQLTQSRYATVGDGTYHVAGYVRGQYGARIYTNWLTIIITGTILIENIVLEYDEQALGFPGTIDGGTKTGGILKTDGTPVDLAWAVEILNELNLEGVARAFVYQSLYTIDIGRVAACPIKIDWDGTAALVGTSVFDYNNLFNPPIQSFLGVSVIRSIRIIPVIRVALQSVPDAFALADAFVPADIFQGAAVWGKWQRFSPGKYKGRLFQTAMLGVSFESTVDAICPQYKWLIDVPDRRDHYSNLTVPAAGLAITYRANKDTVDSPFNGGPKGETLPHISTDIIEPTEGDVVKVTNRTVSGCTVKVWNAGAAVARSGVNIDVFGY